MKIIAIIQAHMGSSRLPGKVLRPIGDRTMLARVVRRTRRAKTLSGVVVACADEESDAAIVRECEGLGVPSHRGSDRDVLERYYRTASSFPAEGYARITSDCPMIDPEVVDQVVSRFAEGGFDYVASAGFPRGLDVEVFTAEGLERAWREARGYQREHVTPYFYENPAMFRLGHVAAPTDLSAMRWTVDTEDDLRFVTRVYEALGGDDDFSFKEVLALLERRPDLPDLNRHVRQKKLRDE